MLAKFDECGTECGDGCFVLIDDLMALLSSEYHTRGLYSEISTELYYQQTAVRKMLEDIAYYHLGRKI